MYVSTETLDDLLRAVYRRLLRTPHRVKSSKGPNREVSGVLLEVKKPTARLSRTETKGTVFSCLGETLWYLSGSGKLDFVAWYVPLYRQFSDDKRTLYGAYGPRLRGMRGKTDQLKSVIKLLKKKPQTRQAVVQLFNAEDILKSHKDIPCTCTIQFMIRGKRLHVLTNMRSNDAFWDSRTIYLPSLFCRSSWLEVSESRLAPISMPLEVSISTISIVSKLAISLMRDGSLR